MIHGQKNIKLLRSV